MKKSLILLLTLTLFQLILCVQYVEKPSYSQHKFAISLLNHLQKEHPKESVFYSPHSVYHTLLMAYFAADGETKSEIEDVLGLKSAENEFGIESIYKLQTELAHRFENQTIEFASINKFYVATYMRIRNLTNTSLNLDIETLDFSNDPDQCIKHINKFVAETTRNHIKDFVTENEIDKRTKFAMVNAIYFKGDWAMPFKKKHTERKIFYNQDGEEIYVDMMYNSGMFDIGFIRNLSTTILKMPYYGDELTAMYIFLPDFNTSTAIDKLIDNLTPEMLNDVLNNDQTYHYRKIEVSLPKFSLEKQSELKPGLEKMGLESLFHYANLSGIFESKLTFQTNIIHMAKIEINEEGSIAAASTMLYSHYSMPEYFICDHPFMFVIHDQKFNEVLFAGIYRGPENVSSN